MRMKACWKTFRGPWAQKDTSKQSTYCKTLRFTPKILHFSLEQRALIMHREIKWRQDQTHSQTNHSDVCDMTSRKALPQDSSVQTFQWQCDWCETDRRLKCVLSWSERFYRVLLAMRVREDRLDPTETRYVFLCRQRCRKWASSTNI